MSKPSMDEGRSKNKRSVSVFTTTRKRPSNLIWAPSGQRELPNRYQHRRYIIDPAHTSTLSINSRIDLPFTTQEQLASSYDAEGPKMAGTSSLFLASLSRIIQEGAVQQIHSVTTTSSYKVESRFKKYLGEIKSNPRWSSSIENLIYSDPYQKIIGLGEPAICFIIRQLAIDPDNWFHALESIADVDPIAEENYGIIDKMAEDWITWARKNGYF